MNYLLDTNAWVNHIRHGPNSNVTTKLMAAQPGSVYIGSIVLAELLFGVLSSAPAHQAANLAVVANLRSQYPAVFFDNQAADEYAKIRTQLKKAGTPIGPNDKFIAALALANSMTLVTHNTTEFGRVSRLLLDDWQ